MAGTTVFVAAHPDDEVLGAAAELMQHPEAFVLHVTDGAPRDLGDARRLGFSTWVQYADARRQEAQQALFLAGIAPERVVPLDVPDQEATFALAPLARRLADLLARVDAGVVFTHPYEGGHPDHDATAFAVHAACALLARRRAPPAVHEFTSYHADGEGRMRTGVFLAPNQAATPSSAAHGDVTIELAGGLADRKVRMVASYRTQAAVTALFPIRTERYRRAPRYRFTVAPHAGPLLYERMGWGPAGARWRALATTALAEMELSVDDPL